MINRRPVKEENLTGFILFFIFNEEDCTERMRFDEIKDFIKEEYGFECRVVNTKRCLGRMDYIMINIETGRMFSVIIVSEGDLCERYVDRLLLGRILFKIYTDPNLNITNNNIEHLRSLEKYELNARSLRERE